MGVLRLLLAISVLAQHLHGKAIFGFRGVGGELAVQLFFIISGFYMGLVLNTKYKPGQYRYFLFNRYLRLWPLYFLIISLTLLYEGVMYNCGHPLECMQVWSENGHLLSPLSAGLLLLSNLTLVGQDWLWFFGQDTVSGSWHWAKYWQDEKLLGASYMVCGPAWSLGSELTFYLLAPWLARLRYSYQIGLFLLGLIVHLSAIALFGVTGDPWSFKFFPFSLDYFILGSLAYQFYAQAEVTLAKWKPFFSNYGRYCVYGIVIMYSRLPSHAEQRFFIAVPLFCLILPFLFYATKDMKLDRIIGELSYPFYLCHKLILLIFWPWIAAYCPANFCGAVLTLITILFSWILYRCFEAPIEKWRHQALTKVVEKFELTDRTIPGDVT